jgi:acyl carrier protein
MQSTEFYLLLDEILELNPGTLKGDERLKDIGTWDSLAVISFVALVDEHFGIVIESERLAQAQSVADLYALATQKKAA